MKTYIEYDNKNSMWNNGHLSVYINGELKESIFVDDFLEEYKNNNDILSVDDIINILKLKYDIDNVITIDTIGSNNHIHIILLIIKFMKKILKFICNFLITTIIAYLSIPIIGFLFGFIFMFIFTFDSLNINILYGFLETINPKNFILMRFILIISIIIGLYQASIGKNLISICKK